MENMSFENVFDMFRRKRLDSDFRKILDDSGIKFVDYGQKISIKVDDGLIKN